MAKLSDLQADASREMTAENIDQDDYSHVVDNSDTTDSPAGTSFWLPVSEQRRLNETVNRPSAYSSNQDDLDLGVKRQQFLQSNSNIVITGLVAQSDGHRYTILNVGNNFISITDQGSGSSAANRFNLPIPYYYIYPGRSLTVVYNATSERWEFAQAISETLVTINSFTSTQIKALNSAPQNAVPGTGSSTLANYIVGAHWELDYGTIDYATSFELELFCQTADVAQMNCVNALNASKSIAHNFERVTPGTNESQLIPSASVSIRATTANPTAGDSTGRLFVHHKVVELEI